MEKKTKQFVWMVRWSWNTGEGPDGKVLIFADGKKARQAFLNAVDSEMKSDFYQWYRSDKSYKLTRWDVLEASYFNFSNGEYYSTIRFDKVEVQE